MTFENWLLSALPTDWKQLALETLLWMPNWKWTVLTISLSLALILHPLFYFSIRWARQWLHHKHKNSKAFLIYFLERRIENSISWLLLSLIEIFLVRSLDVVPQILTPLLFVFHFIILIALIQFIFKAIEALEKLFIHHGNQSESRMVDMLAPFIAKSLKALTAILGFLIFLQNSGINVVSVLAGLGLGGLALALAAQDTAANIFGSITIFLDQPFRVGDAIKIQDVEGEVESIGFRSTRIRTFYNSLITIPNSVVAKEKIDNMGLRPCRRIRHTLGLTYNTTPLQIEEFCQNLRELAQSLPNCIKDSVTVAFNGYGESSLNILVNFHIHAIDLKEELELQQNFLLEVLKLAQRQKIDFAFPTRTLQIERGDKPSIGQSPF